MNLHHVALEAEDNADNLPASRRVSITKVVRVPGVRIQLNLTEEQAATMSAVLQFVGGDPVDSRRKHATELLRILRDAGIHDIGSDIEHPWGGNGLYFS